MDPAGPHGLVADEALCLVDGVAESFGGGLLREVEALAQVGAYAEATTTMWRDLTIVSGAAVLALILAAATLRRRTP